MEKPIAAGRIKKFIIDVILGLLYFLLLGYAFTGSKVHEIAAVVFLAVAAIHNIVNIRWYRALNKGGYTGKRKLYTVINIALLANIAALLVTGILNSRYLFPTGLRVTGIGQIHKILAIVGFVLIVLRVSVHTFANNKKRLILVTFAACIIALLLDLFALPYLKRHFLTVEIDRENEPPVIMLKGMITEGFFCFQPARTGATSSQTSSSFRAWNSRPSSTVAVRI